MRPDANRFLWAALFLVFLHLACYMACYKLSTERIVMPENKQEKMNLGKTVKGLVKNKPLIWILIASLFFMMIYNADWYG